MKLTSVLGTITVAAALLLGACGGDDEEATPSPTPTVTASATTTAASTASATPTTAAPSGPTTEAQGAFPELPLDLITDLRLSEDQRQLTVVSTLGPTDFARAGELCVLLRNYSRFTIEPQVRILANDGSTEITYCG